MSTVCVCSPWMPGNVTHCSHCVHSGSRWRGGAGVVPLAGSPGPGWRVRPSGHFSSANISSIAGAGRVMNTPCMAVAQTVLSEGPPTVFFYFLFFTVSFICSFVCFLKSTLSPPPLTSYEFALFVHKPVHFTGMSVVWTIKKCQRISSWTCK